MDKGALRKELLTQRSSLSNLAMEAYNAAIAKNILACSACAQAQQIMGYLSCGHEATLDSVLRSLLEQGKIVSVPHVCGEGAMEAVRLLSLEEVEVGRYNIRTPRRPWQVVNPQELQLVLVPGVGFSRSGARLGRGLGFYDRFLAQLPQAVTIGVAYEAQLSEAIPLEQHDQLVDYLVTEVAVYKCRDIR